MNATMMTWKPVSQGACSLKRLLSHSAMLLATLLAVMVSANVQAADVQPLNALEDINYAGLPGNRVQITLEFSSAASNPASFTIDNPARIALDLPATKSDLRKRSQPIGIGPAKSITAVEVKGRTRVVLNLFEMVPYETRAEGNKVILVLGGSDTAGAAPASAPAAASATGVAPTITNVDFRRGDQGEGRVIITLSDPSIPVDMRQEAGKVVLDMNGASLPDELQRRLDVTDFATPVKLIDTEETSKGTHMVITAIGDYEHLAYQADNQFTVEIRATTKEEKEERKKKEFGYTGERLSLNFQDIEVRAVLQLLADFTGTNIVVSDTVSGNLTLRMQNVPWDQALDIVLKTKGLAKRQNGNVMLIAPSEEIAAREKLELESQKQIEELAPLYSDYIQINYAKAADLAELLHNKDSSLLSERGKATIDERTNTLLVQDTAEKLSEIRKLVARLDVPVRQVLIESRIVIANNDFSRDLGVKFGASSYRSYNNGEDFITIGGKQPGDTNFGGTTAFESPAGSGLEGLLVNLPAANPSGSLGLALGKVGSQLLQLELSAMQLENRGEIVSSPRVITSNQQEATIQQGVEIPYQEASSSGATSVSFKEAVLQLKVTPQITPDDRIIMDLQVNKDSVGQVYNNVPSIDTRNVTTRVLVDNGETLVLGGIYEQQKGNQTERVPFFGSLPGIGWLFKTESKTDLKQELLIFVTPKIVKQGLAQN
jgi:type IV pilus assembly protein PilQ